MSGSFPERSRSIGLEDLIALNEEIAALARAGVPLELGLDEAKGRWSGRLRELTERLTQRMKQGASLAEALEAEGERLPSVYRAVVEAGLKAGRLPEALESLARSARALSELRGRIVLACLYPGIVLVLAYILFVAFVLAMVPRLQETYDAFRLPVGEALEILQALQATVGYWGPGIPAIVILVALGRMIRLRSERGPPGDRRWRSGVSAGFGWLPGMRRLRADWNRASFTEIAAILLEHDVPLPQTLTLAAAATGDAAIVSGARSVADNVREGQSLSQSLQTWRVFPPFMQWMLSRGEQQGNLPAALRHLRGIYRRRALYRANWFKVVLPVALVVLIGGGAVLVYGFTLFLPVIDLLEGLSVSG